MTVTITGTNDAPEATANLNTIGEDATVPVSGNMITDDDGLGVDSDTDAGAVLTVSGVTGGDAHGTLSWNADGSYSYELDSNDVAVQGLGVGQTLSETYTYTLSDGAGGTDTATLTVTITGTNDAPEISITGGDHTVYEAGLLPDGTGVGPTTTEVVGIFTLADADGLDDLHSIMVNTTKFSIAQLSAASDIALLLVGETSAGKLYINDYDSLTGEVSYKYDLSAATTDGDGVEKDVFTVSVSDDGTTFSAPANIMVSIVDDVPIFTIVNDGADTGTGVSISVPNPASDSTYMGQFADWTYGADQAQGIPTLSSVSGNVSVNGTSTNGSVLLDLKDASGNLVGELTLNADGTDSMQVLHRAPTLNTDILLTGDVIAAGPELVIKTTNSSISGLEVTITASDGNNTPNEETGKVNPSAQGWGVENNKVDEGESITFSFNQSVDRFSFKVTGFTGGLSGEADLTIGVYLDAARTNVHNITGVKVSEDGVVQVVDLPGFGVTSGDVAYSSFYGIQVLSDSSQGSNDGFRLNDVTVSQLSSDPPPDLDYNFTLNVVDGDGDDVTQSFNVHIDGESSGGLVVEAIAGTSGADVLTGTGADDILIGGAGDDVLTGDLGADTFVWTLSDQGDSTTPARDTTDFDVAEGDVLNLRDLLQGEHYGTNTDVSSNLTEYLNFDVDTETGELVLLVDHSGGGTFETSQKIVLKNYADTDALATALGLEDNDRSVNDILNKMIQAGNLETDV